MISAKYAAFISVVVNASAGPSVMGSICFPVESSVGSEALTISRTRSFCRCQRPGDDERHDADDQPAAQLVEMVDDREPVLVRDWPNAPHSLRGSCV